MIIDKQYMRRCITLARYAEGYAAPNPMVGAVIVCDSKIIGEGYHRRYGEAHAEVNAVNSVVNKDLLKRSTLYVNLEPCSHYGKTPPCVDLIVRSGIPNVVVGMRDVNPEVCGNGIRKLLEAGIGVVEGVLEDECRFLNRRFITFMQKKRPYIILKWAQTADGFIDELRDTPARKPLKISNPTTKTLNHCMRTHEMSIMVATRTAILDNPRLTASKWNGRNPIRILIDRTLSVPIEYNIFDDKANTLVFNSIRNEINDNIEFVKLDFGQNIIPQILTQLYARNIQSVIVEGGRQLLVSFIEYGVWDECHTEVSKQIIRNGVPAPSMIDLEPVAEQQFGENICFTCLNNII